MDDNECLTQVLENSHVSYTRPRTEKRGREDEDSESWEEVKKRKERVIDLRGYIEVNVTSTEKFPKQFALAKLLKEMNINNITKVKYIHQYKLSVEFSDEASVDMFCNCQHFLDLGWRFQRPYEVDLSYGVIKNIELELSEKELLESITVTDGQVINVKRLKRRTSGEVGWTDSESVRVGFKGSSLPAYLYIFELKIKIEPYVFPVTQCSRCWRFGHYHKTCSSKRIYCPKCGGKHENCETTTYKCINCTNDHMALNKNCPAYLKEKRIREIMAEFNVPYRKAKTMYVPPQTPPPYNASLKTSQCIPAHSYFRPTVINCELPVQDTPTYAQVASTSKETVQVLQMESTRNKKNLEKKKKIKPRRKESCDKGNITDSSEFSDAEKNNNGCNEDQQRGKTGKTRIDLTFKDLLAKLKNHIMLDAEPLKDKIFNATNMILKWLISWIVNNIKNLPVLLNLFK